MKENIKYFFKFIIVILLYVLAIFLIMDIILKPILPSERSIIVEICYIVLDIMCATLLFYIGYKTNKPRSFIFVIIFSFFVLLISLFIKNIYPAYVAFFGFSMVAGTIANILRA